VAYLLVFGVGTIAGMTLITMGLASTFAYAGKRSAGFSCSLGAASGLVSLAFGFFIAYHIGVVDGLFTANPHWLPR
jgi:high-affinity nickel-transport protein